MSSYPRMQLGRGEGVTASPMPLSRRPGSEWRRRKMVFFTAFQFSFYNQSHRSIDHIITGKVARMRGKGAAIRRDGMHSGKIHMRRRQRMQGKVRRRMWWLTYLFLPLPFQFSFLYPLIPQCQFRSIVYVAAIFGCNKGNGEGTTALMPLSRSSRCKERRKRVFFFHFFFNFYFTTMPQEHRPCHCIEGCNKGRRHHNKGRWHSTFWKAPDSLEARGEGFKEKDAMTNFPIAYPLPHFFFNSHLLHPPIPWHHFQPCCHYLLDAKRMLIDCNQGNPVAKATAIATVLGAPAKAPTEPKMPTLWLM